MNLAIQDELVSSIPSQRQLKQALVVSEFKVVARQTAVVSALVAEAKMLYKISL